MRITNAMLSQYLANKAKIKELEQENEVIAIGIKANDGAETKDFVASVELAERRQPASKSEFDDAMGIGWLEKQGLLVHHVYKKVTVVARPSAKKGVL